MTAAAFLRLRRAREPFPPLSVNALARALMTLTATASRARLAMQRLRQSTSMSDFVGELADLLVCAQAPGSCRSTRRSAHARSLHARVRLKGGRWKRRAGAVAAARPILHDRHRALGRGRVGPRRRPRCELATRDAGVPVGPVSPSQHLRPRPLTPPSPTRRPILGHQRPGGPRAQGRADLACRVPCQPAGRQGRPAHRMDAHLERHRHIPARRLRAVY